MTEKLRIFVSGKEGELVNERAFTMDLIRSLYFEPVGSEKRPASNESMKDENIMEVSSSDIYIGIFGHKYSKPTIDEYNNARIKNIPTLIFEKELSDDEQRDQYLINFLIEVKKPTSGLVVAKYKNVVELKKELMNALSHCLTRKFRDAKRLQDKIKREEDIKANEKVFDILKQSNQEEQLEKIEKVPFKTRFSNEFGRVEIIEFEISLPLKKGERNLVRAKMKGIAKDGFLDLAIKDPDGQYYWFPDPQSYDSAMDNGNQTLDGEIYESEWEFILPTKSGEYLAIMGIYENKFENRVMVDYQSKELTVI